MRDAVLIERLSRNDCLWQPSRCLSQQIADRGSDGRLRVSLRQLDDNLSTDDVPFHTFSQAQKLAVGEIVDVQIDMLPLGLVFYPGEQLRFNISGQSLLGTMMPGMPEYTSPNVGTHVVHTGGDHASYLQLPYQKIPNGI